jgi:site-specific DNA-cytosine methylase
VTGKVALTSIGNARRITADGGAHTLLTTSGPGGKYTGPVHYDQVRTLTVAERKRIQGVPDNYILVGNVHDVCLD